MYVNKPFSGINCSVNVGQTAYFALAFSECTTMYSPELAAKNMHFLVRLMCVNAEKCNDFLCLPSV